MNYAEIITIDPERRSGKPCIRNTRITVYDVLDYLASGMSDADIIRDFPELSRDDIRACEDWPIAMRPRPAPAGRKGPAT